MKQEDCQDRLVDLLLSELLGSETPPDVRERVMRAVGEGPVPVRVPRRPPRVPVPLRSARRSSAPILAIAAIVVVAAGLGAWIHLRGIAAARTPVLAAFSGTVDRPAGPLAAGEGVTTGPLSTALLSYPDGTIVELSPATTVVIGDGPRWSRAKELRLAGGRIDAEVEPQGGGGPMVLLSGDARCEVLGTSLSFLVDPERSRLEVTEGGVRFVAPGHGKEVRVSAGQFAEAGRSGFRHGPIPVPPVPGIRKFTLMNADTDLPLREEPLVDGETIRLSDLPTDRINIRADYEGDPPDAVTIHVRRQRGHPTGLGPKATEVHRHPPYFVAGDHWADGRPEDCAAWTPPPGLYHLTAEATYADAERQALSLPLTVTFRISR